MPGISSMFGRGCRPSLASLRPQHGGHALLFPYPNQEAEGEAALQETSKRQPALKNRAAPEVEAEAGVVFDSEGPGYRGALALLLCGDAQGSGRIYQQTSIDTNAKVAFAKLYDRRRH